MPEIRAELIRYYLRPDTLAAVEQVERPPAMEVFDPQTGNRIFRLQPQGQERLKIEIDMLARADLYYVADDMTDLAVAAGRSLPEWNITPSDIPSQNGFILFDKPVMVDVNKPGAPQEGYLTHITGFAWKISPGVEARVTDDDSSKRAVSHHPWPLLWVSTYADCHLGAVANREAGLMDDDDVRYWLSQPKFAFTSEAACFIGGGWPRKIGDPGSVFNLWGKTLLSAWLLMQQPLAVTTTAWPDRASRRRMAADGHSDPAPVRVITLRRASRAPSAGISDREYRHQWIVRGHWRQQPCGPGRQLRRPTWITPHIKGPEGAPMLGGEKVNAWVR